MAVYVALPCVQKPDNCCQVGRLVNSVLRRGGPGAEFRVVGIWAVVEYVHGWKRAMGAGFPILSGFVFGTQISLVVASRVDKKVACPPFLIPDQPSLPSVFERSGIAVRVQ